MFDLIASIVTIRNSQKGRDPVHHYSANLNSVENHDGIQLHQFGKISTEKCRQEAPIASRRSISTYRFMAIESGNGFSLMSGNLAAEVNYLPHENQIGDHKQPDNIALDGIRRQTCNRILHYFIISMRFRKYSIVVWVFPFIYILSVTYNSFFLFKNFLSRFITFVSVIGAILRRIKCCIQNAVRYYGIRMSILLSYRFG